jgi:hypothetical protein
LGKDLLPLDDQNRGAVGGLNIEGCCDPLKTFKWLNNNLVVAEVAMV